MTLTAVHRPPRSGGSSLPRRIRPEYDGAAGRLFWLALSRALAMIATLGIGRFWMVTRLRRYYWSAIRIDGEPLEYTGHALEKLIGFLVAVVFLAVYLALVQVALTFVGLSYFQGNPLALNLSLVAVIPLIFWARYRARRYILARTRWRGIRFGMTPGAWAYTARALLWWLAVILSLGLLYPVMQMKLARFTTARSYFGDLPFRQGGGWGPLMLSWLVLWLPAALVAAAAVAAEMGWLGPEFQTDALAGEGAEPPQALAAAFLILAPALGVWLFFNYVRHAVFAFRYLNGAKTLGGETAFEVNLSTWRVIWIYLVAMIGMGIAGIVLVFLATAGAAGVLTALGSDWAELEAMTEGAAPTGVALGALGGVALVYFAVIAVGLALSHVLISQPLIRAVCASSVIVNPGALGRARQRAHDRQAEAGGFADALGADVGGAF